MNGLTFTTALSMTPLLEQRALRCCQPIHCVRQPVLALLGGSKPGYKGHDMGGELVDRQDDGMSATYDVFGRIQ